MTSPTCIGSKLHSALDPHADATVPVPSASELLGDDEEHPAPSSHAAAPPATDDKRKGEDTGNGSRAFSSTYVPSAAELMGGEEEDEEHLAPSSHATAPPATDDMRCVRSPMRVPTASELLGDDVEYPAAYSHADDALPLRSVAELVGDEEEKANRGNLQTGGMFPPTCVPCAAELMGAEDEDDELDELSDVSSNSDMFHVEVDPLKSWTTEQDLDLTRISHVASLLRDRPLLPADANDPAGISSSVDVQSGIALPRYHCAFRGCQWTCDAKAHLGEASLRAHVKAKHLEAMQLDASVEHDFFDYYEEAILEVERKAMPKIGVTVDRRSLTHVTDVCNDENCYALICMFCAQVKTCTGVHGKPKWNESIQAYSSVNVSAIKYRPGYRLSDYLKKLGPDGFEKAVGYNTFIQRYAQDWFQEDVNPNANAPLREPPTSAREMQPRELGPHIWEWKRCLLYTSPSPRD